jgi:Ca-activated chloride channel homolog
MLRTMVRRYLVALATLFLAWAPPLFSQTEPSPIRVNVDLVSVAVRVTDKQGHDVQGLTAEDFTLTEEGQKQKIAFFDSQKDPIALTIVLDSSSSMKLAGKMDVAQDMLDRIVSASRPEDEVSLLQFADHLVGYRHITSEQRQLSITTGIAPSTGGTALYDAIASALCRLEAGTSLRQAVVVITDGADQHSRLRLEELMPLVQSSKTQLFMIGLYINNQPEYEIYKQREKSVTLVTGRKIDNPVVVFERLAKESGAESFFPTSKKGLEQALQEISSILRAQYTLAYYPASNVKKYRPIQVKVRRAGVTVRARHAVSSPSGTGEGVQFEGTTCEVSAQRHPFPYELRLTQKGENLLYQEDFSDPRSGWPNRPGSRYTATGYELSFEDETHRDNQVLVNSGPLGTAVLAAYGLWWNDFRASVEVDPGWAKLPAPIHSLQTKSDDVLYASSAGLAFRVNDAGYYAFLLNTTSQAYEEDELSFKLVRNAYWSTSEVQLVPWTRLAAKQIQQKSRAGIKLSVECIGAQIILFVEDEEVARVRDAGYRSGYLGLVSFGDRRVLFRDLLVEGTS